MVQAHRTSSNPLKTHAIKETGAFSVLEIIQKVGVHRGALAFRSIPQEVKLVSSQATCTAFELGWRSLALCAHTFSTEHTALTQQNVTSCVSHLLWYASYHMS